MLTKSKRSDKLVVVVKCTMG